MPAPHTVLHSPADATKRKPMGKTWLDGALCDTEQAKVSVFDHGLLYGDGCFEGIRVYNGRIFKLASHLQRMYTSAERIRLTPQSRELRTDGLSGQPELSGDPSHGRGSAAGC